MEKQKKNNRNVKKNSQEKNLDMSTEHNTEKGNNNVEAESENEEIVSTQDNKNMVNMKENISEIPIDNTGMQEGPYTKTDEDEKSSTEEDVRKFYNDLISTMNKVHELCSPNDTEFIDVVQQYNGLEEQIFNINGQLKTLKTDLFKANENYDKFRKKITEIIDDGKWGEKMYYLIPIIDDYDSENSYDITWVKTIREAVLEENLKNLRLFIQKNLYNSCFTTPKEIYFYKVNSKFLGESSQNVAKFCNLFASRIITMFKYIKDLSDLLRQSLMNVLRREPLEDIDTVYICEDDVIKNDYNQINGLIKERIKDASVYKPDGSLYQKYIEFEKKWKQISEDKEEFIIKAKETYKQIKDYKTAVDSLSKQVYSKSLNDMFRLYDTIRKGIYDCEILRQNSSDENIADKTILDLFADKQRKMMDTLENFLWFSYRIKALKLKEGDKIGDIDINWYDVLTSDDAPNQELTECISSISDTGFARFTETGEVEIVVKTAKLSVYNKNVIPESKSE